MARPVKWRKIDIIPRYQKFCPADANPESGENVLKLEELEAIRLKDLEGLEQAACAKQMEVSRPTFQRILLSARGKISDSLIHGKTIRIDGGHYTRSICPVRCLNCGREWSESMENLERQDLEMRCPKCNSHHLLCCPDDPGEKGEQCRRKCRQPGT